MGYKLPVALRESLRKPIGELFVGDHSSSARTAIKYIEKWNKGLAVAVGDVCARSLLNQGFYPDIIVFDGKTQRNDHVSLNLEHYSLQGAFNPKEWILESAIDQIKNAIAFSTSNNCRIAVRIDGEEDLLIIPVIISLPLGSIVIYGQPPITTEEGLVVALITSSLKNKVQDILKKFEFHEEYINGNHHY
ncbi:MAG: GTP-dependent dephospho-CoA kinase family protein [Candidatus Hodarchaeales archaeon]